ncbi:MAG: endonuclease III [Dehalococcoidia bacterium]|nr:endonuclease III [Dehalococcoidia bacterium]
MLEATEIIQRLRAAYGPLPRRQRRAPLDELVLGVLSQNTSDVNSERAFDRLKASFADWELAARASVAEIEDAVRVGGLGPTKAARIKALLDEVRRRGGALDLRAPASLPLGEAKSWLESLPGVGPKTAAVVLLFSFDMPAMPVDTHVHRVAWRLGLISPRASTRRAQETLESMASPGHMYDFHVYLIAHGRRTCVARRPRCPECALRQGCPSAKLYHPFLAVSSS